MIFPHTRHWLAASAFLLGSALALTGCPDNSGGPGGNESAGLVTHQAYLKAPNAESDDNFGHAVALSGDTIVVGARREDSNQTTITQGATASADNSATNAGAAYVFTLP